MTAISSWTSGLYTTGIQRYRLAARWFHWLTALLIFAVVPLGWIFAEFKVKNGGFEAPFPGSPNAYASAHKTIGLLILLLVIARLGYRIANRPPTLPARIAVFEKGLAHATHWLLYLVMLVMPVSGYIMSSHSKHPITLFGLYDMPKLPVGDDVAKTAAGIHLSVQFALYALVTLHVAAVCWHLFVRRDDLLGRMLPRQANVD